MGGTYKRVSAQHVFVAEWLPFLVDEFKGSANLGLPDAFGLLGDAFPCHALFLVGEVRPETAARGDEEDGRCEVEGLDVRLASPCNPGLFNSVEHSPDRGMEDVLHPCCVRGSDLSS